MAASLAYRVRDDDLCQYLIGAWKRNLEWREFGLSFQHLRTSNSVIVVRECQGAAAEPGTRFLDWRFGKSLDEGSLKLGFTMQFVPGEHTTLLEWTFKGRLCHGEFNHRAGVATLNFRDNTGLVSNATYRAVDENTMAVCLVEADSNHTAVVQYGHMCRLPQPAAGAAAASGADKTG